VASGTSLYGFKTDQFAVQALMYCQYYLKTVEMDLQLAQGGACFAMTPIVTLINPVG
jgi:hypothetical protein